MSAEGPRASVGVPATPRATYRIQLHAGFTLDDAAALAPYLAELGVSHLYLSPILAAVPGSTHGYDVVDPSRVDPEIGGEEAFARLVEATRALGLGLVVDIVPNHMAVGPANPWWWDVLENGPASPFASYFDVEWEHPEPYLRDRVLLPVLADHYGRVLESGELRLALEDARVVVRAGEQRFPVSPRSLGGLLRDAAARVRSDELGFLADALADLPAPMASDPGAVARRARDARLLLARVRELIVADASVAGAVAASVAAANADVDALDALLEAQNYRLAWWRAARRDLGYRRFFDVTTLAGLRTEDERVFEATHRRILDWLAHGQVDGVRVDHPDGLRDPQEYFARLRERAPGAWIVAEKVLEPGERLRPGWPIDGTTGYEFLNRVLGLLVDPAGLEPLLTAWCDLGDGAPPWQETSYESRLLVLDELLGSELGNLTALLLDVLERHRRHRDHTRHDLHEALRELLAAFPVYRTYVRFGAAGAIATAEDEAAVRVAVDGAKERRPDVPGDLLDVLGELLLGRIAGDREAELVARFQQLSGPVMAKGVEDTAFYRDLRLVALDEVGGDPSRFGLGPDSFHAAARETVARWPATMLTTATHDTKRGEDVRARLAVLSEVPTRWSDAATGWSRAAARHRAGEWPDRATEYLLWQTLVGAWPIDGDRLVDYLRKAIREAKVHTTWTEPNEAYEAAVEAFARAVLADGAIVGSIEAFVGSILVAGRTNGLVQVAARLTAPGVPDTYRGTELWDHALVDPDNRRPVDWALRRRLLDELADAPADRMHAALADPADPGRPKLWLLRRLLALRARRPDAFGRDGSYAPLAADGPAANHVIGWLRGDDVAVVLPRLTASIQEGWRGTAVELPAGEWVNVLDGARVAASGRVELDRLFAVFPVAVLERDDAAAAPALP